jgi:hypothetical protein
MPTIKINDLHPTGAELFSDSESYMNELGDNELDLVMGGRTTPVCRWIVRKSVEASRKGVDASKAFSRNPKETAKKASRAVTEMSIVESIIQLSNPFNSF